MLNPWISLLWAQVNFDKKTNLDMWRERRKAVSLAARQVEGVAFYSYRLLLLMSIQCFIFKSIVLT